MKQHSISNKQDLDPALIRRDVRPFRQVFAESTAEMGGVFMVIAGIAIAAVPILFQSLPVFYDIAFVFAMLYVMYARNKHIDYQFNKPVGPEHVKSDGTIDDKAGIVFMGNSREDGSEVWFCADILKTHVLVFGSTGSGKSRFLLGLLYQAMIFGSGAIFVDGKSDNTVFWLAFSLCRRVGREDDLLVINYLIDGKNNSLFNTRNLERKSNTTNPCAHGDSESLRSLFVGLMRDGGGDDMWKGRSSAMLGTLLKALCYLRDIGEIYLDVETIRGYFPLEKIVELSNRGDMPPAVTQFLKAYLLELPGFSEEDAIMGQISSKALEQHGFLIMQLTEVMADLSETYAHIFKTSLGEIDFKDVVFNRRCLFVMLPAIQKDIDALAGLGKLVVAGIKAALSPALGSDIEGTYREVIETKPTTSDVPFLLILDEYGFYSVKGFAVIAAQARSLGVCCIFAGQDYAGFKKGSEEEAEQTIANTNVTVGMKIEEINTFKLLEERAGTAYESVTQGYEMDLESMGMGYKDQMSTRIEQKNRLNLRDFTALDKGQATIIFADTLVPVQLFYADPYQCRDALLNRFLQVRGWPKDKLDMIKKAEDKIKAISRDEPMDAARAIYPLDNNLAKMFDNINKAIEKGEDLNEACIIALGIEELEEQEIDKSMSEEAGISVANGPVDAGIPQPRPKPTEPTIADKESGTDKEAAETPAEAKQPQEKTKVEIDVSSFDDVFDEEPNDDLPDDTIDLLQDENKPVEEESIKKDAAALADEYEEMLEEVIETQITKGNTIPMSYLEKEKFKPRNQLVQSGSDMGSDDPEGDAQKTIEVLSARVNQYPEQPMPEKLTEENIRSKLDALFKEITDKSKQHVD
ncbi:type IV secretory system conjugative DNA transfer family protein [Neptuniibacter sp. QD37_11]|uniref:type IV secretory system conjugative DNA transfer family protein n=1 Tax=Neptuniibacter sp. QD37_11 TaxID=3398209 RepID=UPI0039F46DF8